MGQRGLILLAVIAICAVASAAPKPLNSKQSLGKQLFFNAKLSEPNGQSCASCHAPEAGFADPDRSKPVSDGVISSRFGFRNSMTVAYTSFAPPLHFEFDFEEFAGGLFWDGRADGLADQAGQPFINPLEMHNVNKKQVIDDIAKQPALATAFKKVYGTKALDPKYVNRSFDQMADAIAAYESSSEVNQFSSKYDYFLQGKIKLGGNEMRGLKLFNGKALCAGCHFTETFGTEPAPIFTNFSYFNIGVPRNPGNPFYSLPKSLNPKGSKFIDTGLAETLSDFDMGNANDGMGKFKVPTLRNVNRTAPYGHNGYFKTLKQIVHFYNTRDVPSAGWPKPEVSKNLAQQGLGDLGLTNTDEDDIVSFLRTLTDGYQLPK